MLVCICVLTDKIQQGGTALFQWFTSCNYLESSIHSTALLLYACTASVDSTALLLYACTACCSSADAIQQSRL